METSSTSKQTSADAPIADVQIKWNLYRHSHFDAEIAEVGDDLVYHFWPSGESVSFPEGFGEHLQSSFRHIFRNQPKDADGFPRVDIRAEYTSYEDARVLSGMGIGFPSPVLVEREGPLATFHVKVVGWAGKPLSDHFLRDLLLTHLHNLVSTHDLQEDIPEPDRTPDVAERKHTRRRRRRRRNQR